MIGRHTDIARVAAYAEMIDYPCTRQEMLQMANEQQFPDDVLDVLEDLPHRVYENEYDLIESAGELLGTEYAVSRYGDEVET